MINKILNASVALAALGLTLSADAGTQMTDAKMTAAAPAPEFSWTGFYIGGNAGVNFNEFDISPLNVTVDQSGILDGPLTFTKRGDNGRDELEFIGGGQLGYNYQWNRWVFGIEGDFQGVGDVNRDFNRGGFVRQEILTAPPEGGPEIDFQIASETTATFRRQLDTDWFASLRPRIGYTFGRIMIYATGGVAFADTTLTTDDRASTTSFFLCGSTTTFDRVRSEDENVMVGWTAGGGIEFALTNWLTAGVEYRHTEFDDESFDVGSAGAITRTSQDVNLVNDQVTAKVNVLFMNFFRR